MKTSSVFYQSLDNALGKLMLSPFHTNKYITIKALFLSHMTQGASLRIADPTEDRTGFCQFCQHPNPLNGEARSPSIYLKQKSFETL